MMRRARPLICGARGHTVDRILRRGLGVLRGQGRRAGFVRDVSLELAEYGITVNTVAPGPIDTERFGPGLKKLNETVEYSPNHMTPLKRLGQPFEVAHAVLFLASDEASYVTGHTLAVTGGR